MKKGEEDEKGKESPFEFQQLGPPRWRMTRAGRLRFRVERLV
jgi:hypothetical protein